MSYELITAKKEDGVGIIILNRPEALNALCTPLVLEVGQAVDEFEADDDIGCLLVTGSEKAFAAGADIKEMQPKSFMDTYKENFITRDWERLAYCHKPVIAAVAGYALGGGCEFAMMCDMIIAADSAKFGQPEITLGILPGAGGTQRLTRIVGKSKAMDLCLTGRMMKAEEAERAGLVARVVPDDELIDQAMEAAKTIASMSQMATMITKESVNRAYETTLSEGIRFERRMFHATFATEDQKEGMAAFAEKRKAEWKHR